MKPDVADALSRLVTWVRKDALPMWLERGLRVPGDWFSNQLSSLGEPIAEEEIRLVSQAQMIYIISRAEQIGWLGGRRKVVRNTIDFAGRHGTLPCRSDGFVRSLQPSLTVLDSAHDPADHAWFVMANTACFAAYSEALDLRRIHNILDWMKIYFTDGVAWLGVDQKTRGSVELHRLMLQAFLYLAEVTHKPIWNQRAKDLYQYCLEQFFFAINSGELSNEGGDVTLVQRFAWVRTLCHYERQLHPRTEFAERLYQQALLEVDASISSCAVLAEVVGAGLVLCEAGKEYEESISPYLRRLLDEHLSQGVPGMFTDQSNSADTTGSVATLVSLFEAAVVAGRVLSRR
jgi:N-acyl-D-glucosamine 2-epimerase